ncbi:MAG: hypothetical protein Q9227_001361 [Pyrenula ochraceoflavens]
MDISSLLSGPAEAAQAPTATPATSHSQSNHSQSPKGKKTGRAAALKQTATVTSSPLSNVTLPPSNRSTPTPSNAPFSSPISPQKQLHVNTGTPPSERVPRRQSSTTSMDTLADLASMQHHQPPRPSVIQRSRESYESQLSPSTMYPAVQRPDVIPRSSFDISMSETIKPISRTDFSNTSLPVELQQQAKQLAECLLESPHHYQSHFHMIKLLHQGYRNHLYPPSLPPGAQGNPQTYDLLNDLRLAREAMDKHFAIGEDLWADWLQDESMLAQTLDQRMMIMDKCQRAVEEEFGSVKLWVTYGEWMLHCYEFYHTSSEASSDNAVIAEEERLGGAEVFTWDLMMSVWEKAVNETRWRMPDSHLVWNRYIELFTKELERDLTSAKVQRIKELFEARLQVPHKDWDNTAQLFSTFLTTHMNHAYEETMVSTSQKAANAKAKWDAREILELKVLRAQESGDFNAEYQAFIEYIEFERMLINKKKGSFHLKCAIYQRAELRFPSDESIWIDHALFVIDQSLRDFKYKPMVLPLLERATRHCPWSGSLWAQYLLTAEKRSLPYEEVQNIKNKATTTGLLEEAGLEEVLKVEMEWCNYLRRRAFRDDSTNDDLDIAEIGIRSSIENLQELGRKVYGKEYQGDPKNRLEYIYVKFLSQSRSWDTAREVFKGLIKTRGDRYDFWMRYYLFEMITWAKFTSDGEFSKKESVPHYGTAVLRQAMKQTNLDWPEKIMQAYITHCEDHEEPEELQRAVIDVRKKGRIVFKQHQKQAEEAAALAASQAVEQNGVEAIHQTSNEAGHQPTAPLHPPMQNGTYAGKRKYDDGNLDEEPSKRAKPDRQESAEHDQAPATKTLQRDRENATILIHNLPESVQEIRIRQYFRDCGTINSLRVLRDSEPPSAVVEFEDKQSALAALTRDGKDFTGQELQIQLGSGSTLYVANYPPTADENFIRDLFTPYGEIVDIRFPSLKYDTHRRFCYVQFKLNSQAQAAAEAKDGEVVSAEGLHLLAKISNPLNKQDRSGATAEGRELFVKNLHRDAAENDVKTLFSTHGKVDSVRIPRNMNDKSKGFGYVIFETLSDAQEALNALNGKLYLSRPLHIEIASAKKIPKHKTNTIISRIGRSESVDPNSGPLSPSAASTTSASSQQPPTSKDIQSRTISLLDVPDTVNEARIRALVEPHGSLVKISLRPDHQGAVIEFADANGAGKAALELEGHEIVPGRKLGVGTVAEMLSRRGEKKHDKIVVGKGRDGGLQASAPIRRPGAAGSARGGGRRGGLGFIGRRDPAVASGSNEDKSNAGDVSNKGEDAKGGGGKKSQDDFRKMLTGA